MALMSEIAAEMEGGDKCQGYEREGKDGVKDDSQPGTFRH